MKTRTSNITMDAIEAAKLNAILKNLGVVDMIRFLQYAERDRGDYTKERHSWLGNPELSEIAGKITKIKKRQFNSTRE